MATFLELLGKKLSKDLFAQVTDELGDDFDFDLVPRSRLNKVIAQRNELKTKLASQTQRDDDDDDIDNGEADGAKGDKTNSSPAGTITEKELQKQLKLKDDEKDAAIKALTIKYAALDKLRRDGAIDPDLVFKSVLDSSKLTLDDKGELIGYDDQIKTVKEMKAFLFSKPGQSNVPGGTGKSGGAEDNGGLTGLDARLNQMIAGYGVPTE